MIIFYQKWNEKKDYKKYFFLRNLPLVYSELGICQVPLIVNLINMDKELNTAKRNVFDRLIHDERIFKNRESLSTSYVPSEFPHRYDEINEVANILKTAFYGSRPSNILIYGQTGTGKTAIAKFICKQLKEKAENENVKINTAYINCKQTNSPYGVLTNIGKTYSAEWEKQIPNAGWRIDKVYSSLKEKADENGGIAIVILD